MNRRNFLRTMVGGVAVAAAARTWPFRVYSFSTEIARPILPDSYITNLSNSNLFQPGDDIMFLHPTQAKALNELTYRVIAVDSAKREITFEALRRSRLNWKGLNRFNKSDVAMNKILAVC